ncbi:ATP-grasp domain-containing protein [Actinokineospora auranticolor]|uniref:Biotin carboxylase n=1 Tax=Actinokineospora auranticolor TaxID=155976 RepID=A0A2S6GKH2_9PSEU|nr:ATP-grasp domain-containing protein [Actinokineospora auranticolor]PPK65651.1 biotin carboxylase [Actinokineospora auranticolor]
MSTLLLVGGTDETVVKAKDLGLAVLLLQHPTKVTPVQEAAADVLRVVDFTRWAAVEPVVEELWDIHGFDAVVSLTEPGLDNAGRINDRYGLGGTGLDVTRRFRDKLAMRAHLARHDPDAVGAEPLEQRTDLDAFAARYGYPFIVKPTDATAGIGVLRVDGPADLDRAWALVARLRGTRTDRVSTLFVLGEFLMEQYLDGPEYSVETFSFAGRHVVVAVTEKFSDPDCYAELGHAVPARISADDEDRIRAEVPRFLTEMGLRDGVAHTEVRVGSRGVAVIESHNRVAGDAIPELVQAAYGVDLVSYSVGWPFGLVPQLPDRPVAYAGASTRAVVGEPGVVTSVDGVTAATVQDGVLVVRISAKPGDEVRALRDNWDRLGLVAVAAEDTDAALEAAARLVDEVLDIRVQTPAGARRARVAGIAEAVSV